uniref:Uncharacterized protein n=1 Tax=Pelusios castaneus TaxID=367368 RepID=A0A8C8VI63_9SAUR
NTFHPHFNGTISQMDDDAPENWRFTSFPDRYISVRVLIFLFISQVTGVYCDRSLDFLLCHLHAVIENLEELFRLLIFC